MIDIQLSYYSSNLYRYRVLSGYNLEQSHMIDEKELKQLKQDLEDALWLVKGFIKDGTESDDSQSMGISC